MQVSAAIPEVSANAGKHHACVGGFAVGPEGERNRCVVISTIDNLLKGARRAAWR